MATLVHTQTCELECMPQHLLPTVTAQESCCALHRSCEAGQARVL